MPHQVLCGTAKKRMTIWPSRVDRSFPSSFILCNGHACAFDCRSGEQLISGSDFFGKGHFLTREGCKGEFFGKKRWECFGI